MNRSWLSWVLVLGAGCAEVERLPAAAAPSAGPTVLRRLNRSEYDNTVRDLLGTTRRPAADFPADARAHGFDNVGEALHLSPTQLELYERAAGTLAREARDDPAMWSRFVPCSPDPDPRACARTSIAQFGPRAWRRPLGDDEVDGLLALYDQARAQGDAFEDAMAQVLQALLLSPHFVFKVEHDPEGPGLHPVSGPELASRLSYLLWSSMPDETLASAARDGILDDPDELERQVRRMLDDPRAMALVDDFGGQWLYIRALDDVFRDASRYPQFDEPLREAMRDEMRALMWRMIEEDRDVRDLLRSTTTIASSRLVQHYGLATAPYDGVREVDLAALPRRGWLTTPGLLTALSPPFRTSPTQRGRWVMSQLLCQQPPDPPPGVEASEAFAAEGTIRERLEAHRADPACAGCHAAMDPIGLSFEHYDAVGAWRATDRGAAIDPSGTLPTGEAFADAVELSEIIASDPAFIDCTVRNVLTYALGRAPQADDEPHVQAIVEALPAHEYRFVDLLVLVVRSAPFRHRRPAAQEAG
ncbi:MAG: DUF1592 domain-containing protein [Deltaproteobacteria bacterium]|nr:DUF1592 domain-containing protein [Deltaproteobacteria bacterium]